MCARLWDKGGPPPAEAERELAERVDAFTVGNDPEVDANILADDCRASIAHASALRRAGVLDTGELERLRAELLALAARHETGGGVPIVRSQEDCHTAIEQHLTERLGPLGKKIHTGRSRNDQVLTALRLLCRRRLLDVGDALAALADTLLARAAAALRLPMRGYTHTRPAMPTTLGAYLAAHAESLLEDAELLRAAYALNDRCPLGTAAGFGSIVPLDREHVRRLLGFERLQVSALNAQSSRGKVEAAVLGALESVQQSLGRLAGDLILFGAPELGFLELPDVLTTGSSIMPQKRNPDVLELVRARVGVLAGARAQVRAVATGLPSGYNRDYQLLKEPLVRGLQTVYESLDIMERVVRAARFDEDALAASCTPEIFAADVALERSLAGVPFRDAYREAMDQLAGLTVDRAFVDSRIDAYATLGSMGRPGLEHLRADLDALTAWLHDHRAASEAALAALSQPEPP